MFGRCLSVIRQDKSATLPRPCLFCFSVLKFFVCFLLRCLAYYIRACSVFLHCSAPCSFTMFCLSLSFGCCRCRCRFGGHLVQLAISTALDSVCLARTEATALSNLGMLDYALLCFIVFGFSSLFILLFFFLFFFCGCVLIHFLQHADCCII